MIELPVQSQCSTPLGPVRLLASAQGLAGLWFEGQKHRPSELDGPLWPHQDDHPLLKDARQTLREVAQPHGRSRLCRLGLEAAHSHAHTHLSLQRRMSETPHENAFENRPSDATDGSKQ